MNDKAHKSSICGLLAAFLFWGTLPALGVIVHPNEGEPNLIEWTDRPDSNVVGWWSSNATFVVVAPNWLITTRHQISQPATVTIEANTYFCHYKDEWKGGPAENPPGNADIQLIRLTTAEGGNPNLTHYASPYTNTNEKYKNIRIGGYGKGRGELLQTDGMTYGYGRDDSGNTTLRWCTNKIKRTESNSTAGDFTSDIIVADFDGLNEGGSTIYEGTVAGHDSGGGWFIEVGDTWKLAGLSRAVGVHYEEGHEDDPNYILYQAWFRNRADPNILQPDYLDAVRISSYAEWILDIMSVPGDLTGDDWVDFADFSVLAEYWFDIACGYPDWCEGADFEPDGDVDWDDLAFLLDNWLNGWQY
jgi:hypothetical protein